jgi:short subunit fatty acids transporter
LTPTQAILLAGAVAAVAMARRWGRGTLRAALLALAWAVAAVLALAIPDYRVLVAVAYAPIRMMGAPSAGRRGLASSTSSPGPS